MYCTLSSRVTLVPPYSGRSTFSPTFTLTFCKSPFWRKQQTKHYPWFLKANNYTSQYSSYWKMLYKEEEKRLSPDCRSQVPLPLLWHVALCLEPSLAAWCPPLLQSLLWSAPPAHGQIRVGIFWRPVIDHKDRKLANNTNYYQTTILILSRHQ